MANMHGHRRHDAATELPHYFLGLPMNTFCFSLGIFLCWAGVSAAAFSAPLDALLSADTQLNAGERRLELAYDVVNSTLDILKVRDHDPLYAGSNVGDYSGAHLRARYQLNDQLTIDGGLWQRGIAFRADTLSLSSWQAAAQYRFFERDYTTDSSYALRISAWGDSAGSLAKSTPTTVQGKILNTLNVNKPSDVQMQADLLGTWHLDEQTAWTVFAGAGASRVSVDSMSATYTSGNGCNYNLFFNAGGSSATLAAPCGDLIDASISTPTHVIQELTYAARYYQAGAMLQWHDGDWSVRGGYHFQYWKRNSVDEIIAGRGGIAYKTNHIVVAEVMRKVGLKSALFARGQFMNRQFVGEIPFVYNSLSASKFDHRYGFASVGMVVTF